MEEPTKKEEPKEKQLTKDELKDLAQKAGEALFGVPVKTAEDVAKDKADAAKKEVEEKAAADKAAEEAKAAEAKKAAEAAEAKKAAESKPVQAPPAPTAEEIADKVAEKIAPKKQEPAKAPTGELSAEDKANREVIAYMAQDDPDKFRDLLTKFDAFVPAEKAYREKWEKENPGETFDPEDDAHQEFYAKHDPISTEAEQDAFDAAKIEVKIQRKFEQREREKAEKKEREAAAEKLTETLKKQPTEIMETLAKEVDPELETDLAKLKESDPIAELAMRPYVGTLTAMHAELTKLWTPELKYQFSDSNALHVAILQATYKYENELLKGPAEAQLENGRKLVAIEDFNKMTPEQQQKHWTIWMAPERVKSMLTRDFASKIKEDLARVRPAGGKSANGSAEKAAPKGEEAESAKAASSSGKKEFPNTSGGAESGTGGGSDSVFDAKTADLIGSKLFG